MCNLFTHSLALYTCENTQKKFKIPSFRSIKCASQSIKKKYKNSYLTICLARLVLDRFSINRKRTFDRSTGNQISIESNSIICLTQLVLDRFLINRKRTFDRSTSIRISIESNRLVTASLDQLKAIFDQLKLVKLEFSRIFLKQFSMVFYEQTTII